MGAGGDRGNTEMSFDAASPRRPGKRPRTDSPQTDDDPYAFPDDDQISKNKIAFRKTQAKSISPLVAAQGLAAAPKVTTISTPPHPKQTEPTVDDPQPRVDASDEATPVDLPVTPKIEAGAATPEMADIVMTGTAESERPSIGEKKPPSAANPEEAAPPPPPNVKLRQPQKLKRLREQHEKELEEAEQRSGPKNIPSEEEQARLGLRRALVLALDHVGFSGATNEALESFLLMTESYFQSLAEDIARFTLAARRNQPIPVDFDASLARFNISTGALRPHLRNPIHPSKRTPAYIELGSTYREYSDLPLLSSELSGKPEKDGKGYIPSGFPDFPSIHTYRHTPVDVDTVTVHGSGLRYDDGTLLLLPGEEASADDRALGQGLGLGAGTTYAPLLDGTQRGSTARDPKRIREAAAVEAKQAEEALRGLMRASKINKLKEVRAASDRSTLNKKRYTLWEAAMRELILEAKPHQRGGGPVQPDAPQGADASPSKAAQGLAASLREEIADQSMMVNADKVFHRREIARKARKVA